MSHARKQPVQKQLDKLSFILARRALRFPLWTLYKRQFFEYPTLSLLWNTIANFVGNFLSWIFLLSWISISDSSKTLYSAVIISTCQSVAQLLSSLILWILSKCAKLIRQKLTVFRRVKRKTFIVKILNLFIQSQLNKSASNYLKTSKLIFVFIFSSIFVVTFDYFAMRKGVLLSERLTNQDNFSILFTWLTWFIRSNYLFRTIFTCLIIALIIFLIDKVLSIRKRKEYDKANFIRTLFLSFSVTLFSAAILIFLGYLLRPSIFTLYLVIWGIQSIIVTPLVFIVPLIWMGITTTALALPNLVKLRGKLLGFTFLVANITFLLNADSWQMITGVKWSDLRLFIGLLYFFPVLLLIYSQKTLLIDELYRKIWRSTDKIDLTTIMIIYNKAGMQSNKRIEEIIRTGYLIAPSTTTSDNIIIMTKVVLKWLILLIILPLIFFFFGITLFKIMINNDVLAIWTRGYITPENLEFFLFSLNGSAILKIKAAIVLSILTSASTLCTLLTEKDDLLEFIQHTFSQDIEQDKNLMFLFRVLQKGAIPKLYNKPLPP